MRDLFVLWAASWVGIAGGAAVGWLTGWPDPSESLAPTFLFLGGWVAGFGLVATPYVALVMRRHP